MLHFWEADPQTGSGIWGDYWGICSFRRELPCGEKIAAIGSEISEISRVKEIRLAPPSGRTGSEIWGESPEFRRGHGVYNFPVRYDRTCLAAPAEWRSVLAENP